MVIIIFVQLLFTTIRTFPTVPSLSNNDMIMDMDMDHSKAAAITTTNKKDNYNDSATTTTTTTINHRVSTVNWV